MGNGKRTSGDVYFEPKKGESLVIFNGNKPLTVDVEKVVNRGNNVYKVTTTTQEEHVVTYKPKED